MSRTLFREEAVAYRARAKTSGHVLAWRDRLAARTFVALLVALAGSVAASYAIRVEESTTGTGSRGPNGEVVLLLPIGAAARLAVGEQVRIGDATTRVSAVDAPRTEGGVTYAVARAPMPSRPVTLPGTARVVLARHPLVVSIVPALGR